MSNLDQQGHDVLVEGRKGLAEGHQARQGGHEKRVTLGLGQNCQEKDKEIIIKSKSKTVVNFTTAIRQIKLHSAWRNHPGVVWYL